MDEQACPVDGRVFVCDRQSKSVRPRSQSQSIICHWKCIPFDKRTLCFTTDPKQCDLVWDRDVVACVVDVRVIVEWAGDAVEDSAGAVGVVG